MAFAWRINSNWMASKFMKQEATRNLWSALYLVPVAWNGASWVLQAGDLRRARSLEWHSLATTRLIQSTRTATPGYHSSVVSLVWCTHFYWQYLVSIISQVVACVHISLIASEDGGVDDSPLPGISTEYPAWIFRCLRCPLSFYRLLFQKNRRTLLLLTCL